MEAEMSCEHRKINGTRNGEVHTENLMKNRGHVLLPRRTCFKKTKMKRGRGMKRRFAMDDRDQASSIESLRRFDDRPIAREGSGCVRIMLMKRSIDSPCPSDLHRAALI